MIRFGVICPEMSGHLNPMMAVARALEKRGHSVTFYQRLVSRTKIEAAGFPFRAFGEKEFPVERIKADLAKLAKMSGIKALQLTIDLFGRRMAVCLRDVPAMAREDRIGAFLVDETTWEGATVAEQLGVPYVTFSNALLIHPDDRVPPFFATWAYRDTMLGRFRNRLAYRLFKRLSRPLLRAINDQRQRAGMQPYARGQDIGSLLLRISQQVEEFDFPRAEPPPNLHYVGPMVDADVRESAPFPFESLNGKRLIYASLGTLQNRQQEMFSCIAAACEGIDAQLVISLGGGGKPESLGRLAGDPIAVEFAPQLELIRHSTLCITHAGLNTALESLAQGVPMVAIPITNDQPGVAARIKWSGCGEFIESTKLKAPRLRELIQQVLGDPSYAVNAKRLCEAIQRRGGASEAAALVENTVGKVTPPSPHGILSGGRPSAL
jgi:MGT family glycosyltransferase